MDEPSGAQEEDWTVRAKTMSQSLLSWMSPRAKLETCSFPRRYVESQSLLSWMSPRAFIGPSVANWEGTIMSQSLLSWMSPRADRDVCMEVDEYFVSIPVVVDEPSGVYYAVDDAVYGEMSQSLLSWMSPRARGVGTPARAARLVSIPVVVDEPSGAPGPCA